MDEEFRQQAIKALMDLGLTEDEAEREADEFIEADLFRQMS